jgi:tol-pal system protein YbgF
MTAPVVAIDPQAEQAAYRQAFEVLKEGRYEDSINAFARFLQTYPEGQYADNAVYWMGEANYVLRRFPQAIENFNQVLSRFPNSPKLADAQLKIGFSHYELQAWPQARQVLEQVLKDFPATTAAQLAQNRLHQMKLDGR